MQQVGRNDSIDVRPNVYLFVILTSAAYIAFELDHGTNSATAYKNTPFLSYVDIFHSSPSDFSSCELLLN